MYEFMKKTSSNFVKTKKTRGSSLPEERGNVPPSFGPYLAALRRESGLTLREAGAELGVSNGYLSLIETGERLPRPSVTLAQRIAVAFNRPTDEVLAAQGLRPEALIDRSTLIERAFRMLMRHPALSPQGMDAPFWLDSFSTRQKNQIVEFAQKLKGWEIPDADQETPEDTLVIDILEGFLTTTNTNRSQQ